jgi:hypothetical protein
VRLALCLLVVSLLAACAPAYAPIVTPAGTANLHRFAPGLWRMGQPPSIAAWEELRGVIAPNGERVVVVKLNDVAEGSDAHAVAMGWILDYVPLYPEDDKPWTVLLEPDSRAVRIAVDDVLAWRKAGYVVVWHCSHGEDRTGLVSGLVGMRLLGWTKEEAWRDMLEHGFHWELPGLDAYWSEKVK